MSTPNFDLTGLTFLGDSAADACGPDGCTVDGEQPATAANAGVDAKEEA